MAVRGSWGAPCLGEMNPALWFLSACRQLCKEESALNPKPVLGYVAISACPLHPLPSFSFQTTKWRRPGVVVRGLGWALTSGVQAAGSQDAGWRGSSRVALAGMKHCAGISRLALKFQKSEPCSLGSISRPQIESDPFIFQVLCEKGKKKKTSTKMPGLLFTGLEGTVTFNLTLCSAL